MHLIVSSLILATLTLSGVAHASPAPTCESAFIQAKSFAPQAIESEFLTSVLALNAEASVRARTGHMGFTAFTLDHSIDLSKVNIEGLEARESTREGERFGLDILIRDPSRMHDIWKASLASEVDALAYLMSVKLGLPVVLKENPSLKAFHVVSGDSTSQFGDPTQTENRIGETLQILGLETRRLNRFDEAELILKLKDNGTGDLIEMTSRSGATATRALRTLLATGTLNVRSPGIIFSIPSDAPVGTRRLGRSN